MTDPSQFSASLNLQGRLACLNASFRYLLLSPVAADAVPQSTVVLTDNKSALLAALGASPLLDVPANEAFSFRLPAQAGRIFQVYGLQDGFLPEQWVRTLLDQREPWAYDDGSVLFGVPKNQIESIETYRNNLHVRSSPHSVAAETWQSLARQLSAMGASPVTPLDPALAFQPRVAHVLKCMVHGFGQGYSPALGVLVDEALKGVPTSETHSKRVLWVSASQAQLPERSLQSQETNTRHAIVYEIDGPSGTPMSSDALVDVLPASHWDDGPGEGFDAVVVHDLAGWSLQHVKGDVLRQTLEAMLIGREHWVPLLQEGVRLLLAQLKPGGRLIAAQCALQKDQELNWGYDPFMRALKAQGGTLVTHWAAWPNDSTWFQGAMLADGAQAHAVLNVGLAAEGPFSQITLNWQNTLAQGQGLALARAWCCVLDKSGPSAHRTSVAAPFGEALVYQHRKEVVHATAPDSPLLANHTQTAQLAFFEVATQDGWSMTALGAVYSRYLQAVQTLIPEAPLRKWLRPVEPSDLAEPLAASLAMRLCQAMPDRLGWDRSGEVFLCPSSDGQQVEALLEVVVQGEQQLNAPRWLLASLLVLLRGVPRWGLHEHTRIFTRLQWAENLLAQVGVNCLASDWQQAGIEPHSWAANQNLPTPEPSAEVAVRDARISTLEHQLHYEQTDKNVALEQWAAASEVARGVTADVRRVVTQEVTVDVRRRVSAEYEASLSWRVSKPLRKAKSLLGRLRSRGAAPAIEPPVDTATAPVPAAASIRVVGDILATHAWASAEPSQEFSSDYLPRFDYARWVVAFDQYDEFARQALRQRWEASERLAVLGLVILPATSMTRLALLLRDLLGQAYPAWQAVILVSPDMPLDEACAQCIASDSRLKTVTLAAGDHMQKGLDAGMRALASDVQSASALQADARLNCVALSALAQAFRAHPEWQVVYGDVDTLNEKGQRSRPYFKPDWNEALFFSSSLAPGLQDSLVSGSLWAPLSQWQALSLPELPLDAQGWALAKLVLVLQVGLQAIKGVIGHVSVVMSHHPQAVLSDAFRNQGLVVLGDYFGQEGESVGLALTPHGVQVRWPLPSEPALVSLIIPTRNNPKLLSQCVSSILEFTQNVNFEVIVVDNGSDTPQALATLRKLGEHPKVRVVRDSSPFNYSALNNHAVSLARGQWVALVNDDIEVLPGQGQWLAEMLRQAARPQVGVVGAKLLYPDGTVQHAGVFLVGTLSWHAYRHFASDDPGHGGQAQLARNSSCLTAACIVVRKSIYEQVGGLDADHLTVGWNDTDFCLKVVAAGYQNIWTPDAVLVHHESATRGQDQTPEKKARAEREWRTMQQRWGEKMSVDPAYNPNLSCGYEDYSWAWPPRGLKAVPGDTP